MSYQTLNESKVSKQIWVVFGIFWFFFSNLVSQLEFKKSPVQVYVKPNFKLIEGFKANLGCIWVILIFSLNRFLHWMFKNPQFRYMPYQTLNESKVSEQNWAVFVLF